MRDRDAVHEAVTAFRRHLDQVHVLFDHQLLEEPCRDCLSVLEMVCQVLVGRADSYQLDLAGGDRQLAASGPVSHRFSLRGVLDVDVLFLVAIEVAGILFLLFCRGRVEQSNLLIHSKGLLASLANICCRDESTMLVDEKRVYVFNCCELSMAVSLSDFSRLLLTACLLAFITRISLGERSNFTANFAAIGRVDILH